MSTSDWSVPETDVFDRIRTDLEAGTDAVLATVVDVEGSAYRRPGAKMLIRPDGAGAGSITAGCLEDEVRALAADVLAEGAPRIEVWDLTGDNDVWGMGLGCNGVVTVLLEPLDESFRPAAEARLAGDPIGVATVVSGDDDGAIAVGDRAIYDSETGFADGVIADAILAELDGLMAEFVAEGDAGLVTVEVDGDTVEVFCDGIAPPPELVVFGTGHDVGPVVEFAKKVDFRVTVVGYRGSEDLESTFPAADDVVTTTPRDVTDALDVDDETYTVLMTHNFVDDRLTLDALLGTPTPYVGIMGPEERFEEMVEDFDEEGRTFSAAELNRIYTPIGLNLGGGSPYQVAMSIVAELLAVANDRDPYHLADHEGTIHARVTR